MVVVSVGGREIESEGTAGASTSSSALTGDPSSGSGVESHEAALTVPSGMATEWDEATSAVSSVEEDGG